MRVGIDVRPAVENTAGIGKHTSNMVRHLLRLDASNEYRLFSTLPFRPETPGPNVRTVVRPARGLVSRIFWNLETAREVRRRFDRYITVGSLQVAALTSNLVVLVIPDITHALLPEFHEGKGRLAAKFLLRRALARSRWVVAASHHTRDDIIRYTGGGIDALKVKVAHIACDEMYRMPPSSVQIEAMKQRYAITSRYILFVGTIEPRKNIPSLIRAFERIATAHADVHLLVAGKPGWHVDEIVSTARRSPVAGRIQFLDYVPESDMPSLYAGASLFVYPSLYEGFGIPPLEAMTCGTPVITSNTSSLPEVVGEAAIQVDPRNEEELADAIVDVKQKRRNSQPSDSAQPPRKPSTDRSKSAPKK